MKAFFSVSRFLLSDDLCRPYALDCELWFFEITIRITTRGYDVCKQKYGNKKESFHSYLKYSYSSILNTLPRSRYRALDLNWPQSGSATLQNIFSLLILCNFIHIKTFYKTRVTCCNEPCQLLALPVLPRGVSVPLGNEAGDRRQQVEDYNGEWIPVAKSKHQLGFEQEYRNIHFSFRFTEWYDNGLSKKLPRLDRGGRGSYFVDHICPQWPGVIPLYDKYLTLHFK